jgi:hypothetical protein
MTSLGTLLNKSWIHSHEEDTPTEMVFRPESYPLPPSRGRTSFQLFPDGIAKTEGPGPTDAPESGNASWSLSGDNVLQLQLANSDEVRNYPIASVDPTKLVIQK